MPQQRDGRYVTNTLPIRHTKIQFMAGDLEARPLRSSSDIWFTSTDGNKGWEEDGDLIDSQLIYETGAETWFPKGEHLSLYAP